MYIYIYIYREREIHICTYIYIYTYLLTYLLTRVWAAASYRSLIHLRLIIAMSYTCGWLPSLPGHAGGREAVGAHIYIYIYIYIV